MHEGDRGNEPATLGGLVYLAAIVLCCFIVAILAYSSGQETERRDKTPAAYSETAKTKAKQECAGAIGDAAFECIYEISEASRQQAHDEQDLSAQQKSANGTMITAALAFLGLIASVVGIGLVYTTFNETRKANNIAKETLFRQLRAYVTVEALESADMTGSVSITLHNSGATPSKGIKIIYNRMQVDNGLVNTIPTEIDVPDIGGQARKCLFVEWYNWSELFHAKSEIPTTMRGSVIYRSVVPDEKGQTPEFVEAFSIEKSVTERKGVLQVEITRLPERTFFS